MDLPADLVEAWRALIDRHSTAEGRGAAGRAVLADWAQPHRRYHDLDHLRAVLRGADELAADADDPDAVRLAAWYHDVVYLGRGDADLAVLARPAQEYARYRAAVRAEYAHVDDDAFRTGRAAVLRALLADPGVYRTAHGRRHWEARARANLTAELAGD